jgi:hypothetical protein
MGITMGEAGGGRRGRFNDYKGIRKGVIGEGKGKGLILFSAWL